MYKTKQPRQTLRGIYHKLLFKAKGEPWSQIALSKAERKGLSQEELQAKRKAKWLIATLAKNGETVAPITHDISGIITDEVALAEKERDKYMEGKERLQMHERITRRSASEEEIINETT